MKPFVKWAGGKRQILNRINEFINDCIHKDFNDITYIEPFLGGGAVFFDRTPQKAIINDLNSDLINVYKVIKSDDYQQLIDRLEQHKSEYLQNPDEYYYDVRAWDRTEGWPDAYSDIERAARMIFLNKTCYNGLYRVNSKGQYNTPIGRYKNPLICDAQLIKEVHDYLSSPDNDIKIMNSSYEHAIAEAKDGDIIYIDPPYDYEDDDGFTKYQMNGFTFDDFKNLKVCCDQAISKGAFVIISNNATEKVISLFKSDPNYRVFYDINKFNTLRSINCNGGNRKTGVEVIIWGMPNVIPFPQANDMSKIIKLIMASQETLFDKDSAMNLLEVGSTRQVAYYMSALKYLKYIDAEYNFTQEALDVKNDYNLLVDDIYNRLLSIDYFKYAYELLKSNDGINLTNIKEKVSSIIQENYNKLSKATIDRRTTTIINWAKWMINKDKTI